MEDILNEHLLGGIAYLVPINVTRLTCHHTLVSVLCHQGPEAQIR